MENNKIERKDFRPAVRYAEFKIRCCHARREREDNVKSIQNTLDDNIRGIKENATFQIRMEEAKAAEAIRRSDERLNETLLKIAEDQADFEAELRNYVANITEEERKAMAYLVEGGSQ